MTEVGEGENDARQHLGRNDTMHVGGELPGNSRAARAPI
jgi:hypothetical protein